MSSALIPLLALCFFAMNFSRNRWFSILAIVVLGRSILIVALAPAAYFKYITSTWLMGWLLLLIYWNTGGFAPLTDKFKKWISEKDEAN